jgi:hypothetical protein
VASTLSALLLLAVTAAGGQRPGSAQFLVSVRVVAPMRARAPAAVALDGATATPAPSGDHWVVRLTPSATLRGAEPGVLVGIPGQEMRPCGGGPDVRCEVAVTPAAGAETAGPVVALVFVPDGAPPAIIER